LAGRLARSLPYLLVGTAAGYLYYAATQIEFHRRAGTLGPDFWPKLVLVLVIATCLYEVVKVALFGGRRGVSGVLQDMVEKSVQEHGDAGEVEPAQRRPLLLVGGIALTAFYVWIIQTLGFFLATALYVAMFIAVGGYRRWAINAAVSVIGTLAMMFFFMKVVYVSLPLGREPFARVTFFLMQVMGIR
jgi:putative tricarboxylic transport membrane protein